MKLLVCLLCLVLLSCDRTATRIEITPLAEGEWSVVDASEDGAILRPVHNTRQSQLRGSLASDALALLEDSLHGIDTRSFSLQVGDSTLQFMVVPDRDVFVSVTGQPALIRSPTQPYRYVFEHGDAIWLFNAPAIGSGVASDPHEVRQLTKDDDLQTLRARQREGVAILYWTTHPVWSADGELVSFLSNREAFRAGEPGQSLWMIDLRDTTQHALVNKPRVSVHTEGVLGEEFVFIGSEPGVFTVYPRTRRVTKRGYGYVAGAHRGGAGIVINDNGRLIVLRGETTDTLPAAPSGRTWNPSAFFSPSGDNIALFSTDNRGDYTLHVFQHGEETALSAAVPGGPSYGPVWASDKTIIFASMRIGGELTTYRADLR